MVAALLTLRRGALALAVLHALGGCSLMQLSDVEVLRCEPGDVEACADFSAHEGIASDACMQYVCAADGIGCELAPADADGDLAPRAVCEAEGIEADAYDCDDEDPTRRGGAPEVCDGKDNDCDLIVDEGVLGGGDERAVDALLKIARLHYSVDGEGLRASFVDAEGRAAMAFFTADVEPQHELMPGCPVALDADAPCQLRELVAAPILDQLWVAGINAEGCAQGQVRVGLALSRDELSFAVGNEGVGDTRLGVLTADDRCTATEVSHGAARVALAGQERGGSTEAMLAWLGDGVERAACGGEPVPVHVLGLRRSTGALRSGGSEAVMTLGRDAGGGGPTLAAWPAGPAQAGYFAAYPALEGGIALHFVAASTNGKDGASPAMSPALLIDPGRRADHVAIALGPERPICGKQHGVVIGLAYWDGCGDGEHELRFARAGYADGALCALEDKPRTIARALALAQPPAILHVEEGFLAEGSTRDGANVDAEERGGFWVAWAQNGGAIEATRIADLDGRPVLPEEHIELSRESGGLRDHAFLYELEGSVRFAYRHRSGDRSRIVEAPLSCRSTGR